jgi:C-terminal peptidase prc
VLSGGTWEVDAEPWALVVRYVGRLMDAGSLTGLSDGQLLERFSSRRDELAFSALVERYGGLVWGTCRRLLASTQDAEDAFQATFFVLARRARALERSEPLGGWLHTVAYCIALKARGDAARRHEHERRAAIMATVIPQKETGWEEVRPVLDEELERLPEKYRLPLVLCYLQGKTNAQAAAELGWPPGSMSRRLSRARELLRARLARRGVILPAALLGAGAAQTASAAVPAALLAAATRAAVAFGHGHAVAGGTASVRAAAWTEALLKGVLMTKVKVLSALLAAASLVAGGAAALRAVSVEPEKTKPPFAEQSEPEARKDKNVPGAGPVLLAGRVWAIMDAVRKNHLEPPADKDMVLASAKGLVTATGTPPPDELPQRAAAVTTEGQLAALFGDLWPGGTAESDRDGKLGAATLDALFESIPGRPVPYSKAQLKLTEQLRENRYVGIGVQLGVNEKEQFPTFAVPFRRGAARTGGVRPGDLILEIDGRSTKGVFDLEKVAGWLRGEAGSSVTVAVRQPGSPETRTLKLLRGPLPIASVFGFRRAGEDEWGYRADRAAGIGYLWVKAIKSSTLHELRQAERRLRAEGVRAVVLDLRFSAGEGHLHDGALVADGLLDGGLMWSVRGDNKVTPYRADREALFRGWPLVALMNDTPDNVQAMVLAALQDNGRAMLVGEPSRNDGLVRSMVHLPDGRGAITLLTGRLERAATGRGWPVRPDAAVALDKDRRATVEKWLLDKQYAELPPGADDRPPTDPQLDRALAVLRESLKAGGTS